MAYRLTFPGQEKELKQSFEREIAEDIWMLEGYVSDYFLLKPASSNTYVLRDGNTLLIVDPGLYPFYRQRIIDLVRRLKRDGVDRVVLTVTQGHFDHVGNNDVILETGIEDWRFVLPEPELKVIDVLNDFMGDIDDLARLYDVYSMFDGRVTTAVKAASKVSPRLARSLLKAHFAALFGGLGTMRENASVLTLDTREKRRFGSVELEGWPLGRFFLIHDASHSPGHISIYDPESRFLMSGDVTVEINPAFYYSSMDRCIEMAGKYRVMAEEGYIELASDSHRSPTFLPARFERWGLEPLDDIQLVDAARGSGQCEAFFAVYERLFSQLRDAVLEVHHKLGEATVPQIVEGMKSVDNPAMRLKKAMKFERFPSRMDVLVATVLREAGARKTPGCGGAVFAPVEVGG
jgi:glyoxylase-like metal-dependent hydrolase (beta-lactamase superfamily II)